MAEWGRSLTLVPAYRTSQIQHVLRIRDGELGKVKGGGSTIPPLMPALGCNEGLGPVAEDQLVVAQVGFLRACQA